ncbi:hypothetical protein HKX48_004484 [Thoreauomyces humboldtii]|nr:hypothetical protein HKX48_004484 [Thoreauomyces humboldtii]
MMSTSQIGKASPPAYGPTIATPTDTPPQVPPLLCCVSLHGSDRLRTMGLHETHIALIRQAILSTGYRIQDEKPYSCSWEFKISGRPWGGSGSDAVPSRRLATAVMATLVNVGWELALTTDVSKSIYDKDTWILRWTHVLPSPRRFCSVSFNMSDRIRSIDAPVEVTDAILRTIKTRWAGGLQSQRLYEGVPEFKVYGRPWFTGGTETMATRLFIVSLIQAFETIGWRVYASIDISVGRGENVGDLDSWILVAD